MRSTREWKHEIQAATATTAMMIKCRRKNGKEIVLWHSIINKNA